MGKGSRNGSAREDRVPHAPGPTRSSSMTGSGISLRIGLRPGSVLHLLHGFPGRGVWRLGSGVQGHGVTTVPSSLSQHRGPACPPAPGLLASRPRSPLKLIPEPVMLPGALLPACPGSCPLLPYRVPRPGAGFRQCALARGAQETGLQAARAVPVSCRLAGTRVGEKGAPHHPQTGEGFWAMGSGAAGWALRAVLLGEHQHPERRPRGARGPQSTGAALGGRGLRPAGHGASQAAGLTAAGPRPAWPSMTLGLVRAPRSLIMQDVRSGLGVGAWSLKWGPWGSSWTEGSRAQERQIWVREGCPGPQADQSQVSWGGGHQRSGGRRHGWSCSWGRG